MGELRDIEPAAIEAESFRIIESEFESRTGLAISSYSPEEFKVVQRVIHATGDFSLASSMVFQHDAIASGLQALRAGGDVVTDVKMVASGVSGALLGKFGGRVLCRIGDDEVARRAGEQGTTRSEAAMREAVGDCVAVLAIGNAPTALVAALRLIESGELRPGLVVGVPVGFVNAAESKELLMASRVPAITIAGRRGGSPIAAAMVNALLRLAQGPA